MRFVDRSSVIKGAAFLYRFYHRFVVIRGGARVGYPARLFSRQAENFVIVVADLFYYPAFRKARKIRVRKAVARRLEAVV